MRGLIVSLLIAGLGAVAHADKATLAALSPATDARKAIAIGPAGQLYEPDGKGAWVRIQAGGVAEQIVSAAIGAASTVIVGTRQSTPFRLKRGAWTAITLDDKSRKAIVGTGSRALAAVDTMVFALDRAEPVKLPDAPFSVAALAASAAGAVIATDRGLLKLEGTAWKPIKKAPKRVNALVSDRWALVDRGVLDLKTLKTIAWPSGLRVSDAVPVGADTIVAVATHGKTVELLTVKAGKVERDKIPIDKLKPIVGLAADKAGRVVVAMRDGRLAVRENGTWTITEVREELAPAKPGPAPAETP